MWPTVCTPKQMRRWKRSANSTTPIRKGSCACCRLVPGRWRRRGRFTCRVESRFRSAGLRLRDEGGMLGRRQALLEDLQHLGEVAADHCRGVEPQSRKDFAAVDAVLVHRQRVKERAPQNEPVNG